MWVKKKSAKRVNKKTSPRPVRLAQKRKKVRFTLFFVSIFLLIPIFVGVAWGSYYPRLNIQSIEIKGAKVLSKKELKSFLESKLDDGKLHIFSPRNELLLSRGELASALSARYPRIKSVDIPFTKFKQKMIVNVIEREPNFAWCRIEELLVDEEKQETETCYLADSNGYIFAKAAENNNLQKIYSALVREEPLRSSIAEENLFNNLKVAINSLDKELSLKILSVEILESDANLHLTDDWFIKIALDSNVDYQVANLKTILDSQELKDASSNIEYVDLRFGNRVYYKLYGE